MKTDNILALDIGGSSIKFIWVRRAGNSIELLGRSIKNIPSLDVKSISQNKNLLLEIIKSALDEMKCTAKNVFLCTSGLYVYTKRVSIVSMPQEELKDAVKWSLKDQIAAGLENIYIEYSVVGESKDEDGTSHLDILAVVAEKEAIIAFVDLIKESGLNLCGISISPFTLGIFFDKSASFTFNSVNAPSIETTNKIWHTDDPVAAVLDIGSTRVELIVFKDGLPQLSRFLPGSGNEITKSMTGVLLSARGKTELSHDEAENLKIEIGLPENENEIIRDNISAAQFLSMPRPLLEKLTSEIKRSFDYCRIQLKLPAPKKIYLTGGGSLLKNLDKFLSKNLSVEVDYLPFFAGVRKDEAAHFNVSLSAALEGAQRINLIPSELKEEKIQDIEKVSLRIIALILVSLLLVPYSFMIKQVYDLRKQIKLAKSNYEVLRDAASIKENIDKRKAMITQLTGGRPSASVILKSLSNAVPVSLELDNFISQEDGKVDIKGTIADIQPESVLVNFTEALRNTKIFKNIKILSLQRDINKAAGLSRFMVSAEIGNTANDK